jgi:hypothetical protein
MGDTEASSTVIIIFKDYVTARILGLILLCDWQCSKLAYINVTMHT